ncbi:MAG: desulfurizing enzyme [Conexibacter sp.]|nr:desulfurizing enzyme [Conexibacter sp.]
MSLESSLATPPTANADPRLSLSRCPMPTTIGLAHQLGWLAHDLRDPFEQEPAQELRGLLREGSNVAALWDRARGTDTRLLGLTWIDEYQGVLAAPDGGIAEPAQLAGRRLALPLREREQIDAGRAAARRGFHAATGLAGVFCDEVRYVDLPTGTESADPYAAEVAALLAGEVDAIYVAGPAGIAVSGRIGAREVVDLGAHLDPMVRVGARTPAPLTVDARVLRAQPELVVRVLATLLRAGAWAELAPREVVALVAAEMRAAPREVVAAYGAGLHQHFHLDLSTHKLAALTAQKEFLLTHGFLDDDIEIAAWVDAGPLAAARELIAVR